MSSPKFTVGLQTTPARTLVGNPESFSGPPVPLDGQDLLPLINTNNIDNRKIAFIGDSMTWQGTISDASNFGYYTGGIQSWLRFLTRQRFDYYPGFGSTVSTPIVQTREIGGMNFGIPSDTTAMILGRLPEALLWSDASIWVVWCGTNDPSGGIPSSTTVANYSAIRDTILAAGRTVLFVVPTPRGDSAFPGATHGTTQRLHWHMKNRQWLLGQRGSPGVFVADPWKDTVDTVSVANNSLGYITVGLTRDGLHQITPGAYYIAQSIATQINELLPPVDIVSQSAAEVWSADNPTGIITLNPKMIGTTGNVNTTSAQSFGANSSGVLADSWANQFLANANGMNLVYSKVSSNNRPMQQVVISGTPTHASPSVDFLRLSTSVPNVVAGDVIEGSCEVEIDSSTNLKSVSLFVYDATGAKFFGDMLNTTSYPGDGFPNNVSMSGVMRTAPIIVPTGANLRFGMVIRGFTNTAISSTIRVGSLSLRKV